MDNLARKADTKEESRRQSITIEYKYSSQDSSLSNKPQLTIRDSPANNARKFSDFASSPSGKRVSTVRWSKVPHKSKVEQRQQAQSMSLSLQVDQVNVATSQSVPATPPTPPQHRKSVYRKDDRRQHFDLNLATTFLGGMPRNVNLNEGLNDLKAFALHNPHQEIFSTPVLHSPYEKRVSVAGQLRSLLEMYLDEVEGENSDYFSVGQLRELAAQDDFDTVFFKAVHQLEGNFCKDKEELEVNKFYKRLGALYVELRSKLMKKSQ